MKEWGVFQNSYSLFRIHRIQNPVLLCSLSSTTSHQIWWLFKALLGPSSLFVLGGFFPKYCWGDVTQLSAAYVLPHSGRWKTKAKRGWLTFSNCYSAGLVARKNLSANPTLLTIWPLGKLPNELVLQSVEQVFQRNPGLLSQHGP